MDEVVPHRELRLDGCKYRRESYLPLQSASIPRSICTADKAYHLPRRQIVVRKTIDDCANLTQGNTAGAPTDSSIGLEIRWAPTTYINPTRQLGDPLAREWVRLARRRNEKAASPSGCIPPVSQIASAHAPPVAGIRYGLNRPFVVTVVTLVWYC
jgi:hypothetical protein